MKHYASRKAALLDAGRIKEITRGRISRENNAWLDTQLIAGEFTIADMSLKASTGPVPAPPTVVREIQNAATFVADIPDESRREEDWEAHSSEGKSVGMRTVCNNCRNSLTYCRCSHPKVWGMQQNEVGVVFTVRKTPLSNKRW